MSTEELKFSDIVQTLPAASEPSADLWSRIATMHMARRRARRRKRLLGASAFAVVLTTAVAFFSMSQLARVGDTDWQARAQALEIELHAGSAGTASTDNPVALDAESELARLDGALQAAYDRGAQKNEMVPLWEKRSKLLATLLDARRQRVTVTLI